MSNGSSVAWSELVPPPVLTGEAHETIFTFIKFGRVEHIESLHRTGRLYMQTLGAFLAIEDGGVRGDSDEGISMLLQHDRIQIEVGGIIIKPEDMAAPVLVAYNDTRGLHVFSMFALTTARFDEHLAGRPAVDPRLREFGEAALIMTNANKFLERVRDAAKKANTNLACSLVHYLDRETHHGPVSPFNKMRSYAWQSEYRIVIEPTGAPSVVLDVGSLEDISIAVRSADIDTNLKLGLEP